MLSCSLYQLQKENLGQRIWDKVRCYWEHVEEHIGNMRNMLVNWQLDENRVWGLDENTFGTTKIQHPPILIERRKKTGPMDISVLYQFWPRLVAGPQTVGISTCKPVLPVKHFWKYGMQFNLQRWVCPAVCSSLGVRKWREKHIFLLGNNRSRF
jgi:hypothetical protein